MLVFFDAAQWEPAVDASVSRLSVCACVWHSNSVWENPDLTFQLAKAIFFQNLFTSAYFLPLFLGMFCLLPLKELNPPPPHYFFFSSFIADPCWPSCSLCPCILPLCLSSQHLPVFPSQWFCFVWTGERKQSHRRHPPWAAQMDRSAFTCTQSMPHMHNLGISNDMTFCLIKT